MLDWVGSDGPFWKNEDMAFVSVETDNSVSWADIRRIKGKNKNPWTIMVHDTKMVKMHFGVSSSLCNFLFDIVVFNLKKKVKKTLLNIERPPLLENWKW